MFFWSVVPDAMTVVGVVCLALAIPHVLSAALGRGRWIGPSFTFVSRVLEKPAGFFRGIWSSLWDFASESPVFAAGCYFWIIVGLMGIAGIVSRFTNGAFKEFMDRSDDVFGWTLETYEGELVRVILMLLLPFALALLFGLVWRLLDLTVWAMRADAGWCCGDRPRLRQFILAGALTIVGIGGLFGGQQVGSHATNRMSVIVAHRESKNLLRANLSRRDLSGEDFSGANLRLANLRGACIIGANLKRADLTYADLSGACLVEVNLKNADLENANLSEACLDGANLASAWLKKTDLRGASLRNANLSFSSMLGPDLKGSDLRGASTTLVGLTGGTILPDGMEWRRGTSLARYTNPTHPRYWSPKDLTRPASCDLCSDD